MSSKLHLSNDSQPAQLQRDDMLAVNRRFAEIINGNKQFIIPVFQRDYSWTATQCLQLWEDVLRASSREAASHFMGSFVYVEGTAGAAFST